ncbi:MAG: hypothetical protein U9N78_07355 [Actinomycetota bacterium]|nr:hypothetical protein [Actinomycetota bacterium]
MDSRISRAVDGFRWPVGVRQTIAGSEDDVWTVISTPGVLEQCHPYCRANPVTQWPGADSRDEVHYFNGWVYERRFVKWIEGVGYSLVIGEADGPTSVVTWRVESVDSATSTLAITVYPHLIQGVPIVVRWLPHIGYVRPLLRRYLKSVVRGFDWYVTRREPVRRNQFGAHPWFSPDN